MKYLIVILLLISHMCYGQTSNKSKDTKLVMVSLVVSATSNAMMDELQDHYSTSFAKNLNPKVWNPNVSWKYCPQVLGYHVDAWHISKTVMVSSMCVPIAILMHEKHPILKNNTLDKMLWWTISGVTWDLVFNVNYNKILK